MLSWAIIANNLKSTQAALVFYMPKENKETLGGPQVTLEALVQPLCDIGVEDNAKPYQDR